jgi:hypothetical protein
MTQFYWAEPENHIDPLWIDEQDEEEIEEEFWKCEKDE